MTNAPSDAAAPKGPAAPLSAFRLRQDPPRVVRFSKKALALLAVVAAMAVGGALVWALTPRPAKLPPPEVYDTKSRNVADQVNAMPKDYSQTPHLGPPQPGDLGRPIVAAQMTGKSVPTPLIGPSAGDGGASLANGQSPQAAAAQQAADQAHQVREAARTSKLFTDQDHMGETSPTPAPVIMASTPSSPTAPSAAATGSPQSAKRAFLTGSADQRTTSDARVADPVSPYVIQAGSVIPAALITGLRSDLPGEITAQVTENVYDSPTGKFLLIPQGARLIGEYDSQVAFGQQRVLLVWTRLILPDGKSLVLERQPGADAAGYAGLEDGVDNHWRKLFQAAVLSTLLSVGAEAGTSNSENNLVQAIRQGASQSFSQAGQQVVQHELDIAPTLSIRPGMPVRVMVARDLVFREPYGG